MIMNNIDVVYNKDRSSYIAVINDRNYEWRQDAVYVELYPGKWVRYNKIMDTAKRFFAIHNGHKYSKKFSDMDVYVDIPNSYITHLKTKNMTVEIIFSTSQIKEIVTVNVRKGDNIFCHSYERDNYFYTYWVLADPVEMTYNIRGDIKSLIKPKIL